MKQQYKDNANMMAGAFGRALGFRSGGLIGKLKKKTVGELIEIAKDIKKDPLGIIKNKSVGELADLAKFSKGGMIFGGLGRPLGTIGPLPSPGPPRMQFPSTDIPFRRGGKIRKGSPAMRRKMARLRAMRK